MLVFWGILQSLVMPQLHALRKSVKCRVKFVGWCGMFVPPEDKKKVTLAFERYRTTALSRLLTRVALYAVSITASRFIFFPLSLFPCVSVFGYGLLNRVTVCREI